MQLFRRTALPAIVAMLGLISFAAAAPAPGQSTSATKIAIANPARIFNEIQETKDLKQLIETKTKNLEQDRFAREQKLKDLKAKNYLFQSLDKLILKTITKKEIQAIMGLHEDEISRERKGSMGSVKQTA